MYQLQILSGRDFLRLEVAPGSFHPRLYLCDSLHLIHSQILHQVLSLLDSTFAAWILLLWLVTPGQLSQFAPGLPTVQLYHYDLGSAITMVDIL